MTVPPAVEAPEPPRGGSWLLGICMGMSNVLGYAFVLVLSRALGPEEFGAFTALNNSALFLTLPMGAFQVVVATHQARGMHHRSGIGMASAAGLLLAAATLALSPLITRAFHLESMLPVVLVAAMMPAFMVTGACQGLLLGHRRFASLAAVYLSIAVARLVAAVVAAVTGAGVTGVFGWLLLAAWVPAGLAVLLAGRHVQRWWRVDWVLLRQVVTSNGALAVLMAMTSTDVLLARHLLPALEAGTYSFAGLFGKVVFWGTQFVALALVPAASVAAGRAGRRAVLRALSVVAALGALVTAAVAIDPERLVEVLGGAPYAGATDLLTPFALVGTAWAVCQVLVYAEMAQARHGLAVFALAATAAAAGVVWVWAHHSATQVLVTYGVTALIVALAGVARAWSPGTGEGSGLDRSAGPQH